MGRKGGCSPRKESGPFYFLSFFSSMEELEAGVVLGRGEGWGRRGQG